MPPRRKKKTAAELEAERLAAEAEEAARKAAEAKRLEEERIRREAEEKRRREEEARLRKEELARLTVEHETDVVEEAAAESALAEVLREIAEGEEWRKFLACSSRPDAKSESDLNTYLSEIGEERYSDLGKALEACETTEAIARDVETVYADAQERQDKEQMERCNRFRFMLRDTTLRMIDSVSAYLLANANELSTEIKDGVREMHKAGRVSGVRVGVWVNLNTKGGRMRSVTFDGLNITVDVPRPIATQLIGVRVIQQDYDHAAATWSYVQNIDKMIKEAATEARPSSGKPGAKPATRSSTVRRNTVRPSEKEGEEEDSAEAAGGGGGGGGGGGAGAGEEKDDGLDAQVDAAALLEGAADCPLTPVFYVELLTLPPPAKTVKAWTLRAVTPLSTTVARRPHPFEAQGEAASAQAMKLRVTIDERIIMPEEPRVATWSEVAGQWVSDGLTETGWDPAKRQLLFHTMKLVPIAVVQSRTVDLPYKTWSLTPTGKNQVRFTVTTSRLDVVIDISEGSCCLVLPDRPELKHLVGVKMSPSALTVALKRSGVFIMPGTPEVEAMADTKVAKKFEFERRTYRDIATLSAAFGCVQSKWNGVVGEEKLLVRMREVLDWDEKPGDVHPTDWRSMLFEMDAPSANGMKVSIIRATEDAKWYDSALAPLETTHCRVKTAIRARATPEALEVAASSSILVQQTVHRLLSLVRPASFC